MSYFTGDWNCEHYARHMDAGETTRHGQVPRR